jgi:hypothetical protein
MPKGRVRIREVPYKKVVKDALGGEMIIHDTAYGPGWADNQPLVRLEREPDLDPKVAEEEYRLGQVVDFLDDDYVRLLNHKCIVEVDKDTTKKLDEEARLQEEGFASKTDEELEVWIRDEKPTVGDVVAASNGDPELAQRLLEAESRAQDGDARKGVVDGLMHVMAQA